MAVSDFGSDIASDITGNIRNLEEEMRQRHQQRKDSLLRWLPNKRELLEHHAKVGNFLEHAQGLGEDLMPDICIKLRDSDPDNENTIMLHSVVGMAHSGYLRKRCESLMRPVNPPELITIDELVDFEADAVRRMINFFYTGVLPTSLAEVPELLALCQKLQVTSMKSIIEMFIVQKASEQHCLLDCWNISCHRQSDLSKRTRDFVLSYVTKNLEEAVLEQRFPLLDQGAVEALLQLDNLPVRTEADVLRIALMYHLRRKGDTNTQSLLNTVRYTCPNEILKQMVCDVANFGDKVLRHCFQQNCAYGLWQAQQHNFPGIWPVTSAPSPRENSQANCNWIDAQFASFTQHVHVNRPSRRALFSAFS